MAARLLIWKTGNLPRRMIARFGDVEQAFLHVLGAGRCVVADARSDPPPETDWAGIVVTGSAASANDTDAWVTRSADFLKRAADAGVPLYGVCFGHQHLARTFGGQVEKSPAGWELGTGGVTLTEEGRRDPLFADVPDTFPAQQSHGEIVVELPPGARTLAHNPHTACQAFALGDAIWGTQFHPEFTSEVVHALIGLLADRLPAGSFPTWPADDQPLRDWLARSVQATPAARRCLDNFAAIVRERGRAESSDDRVDNGRLLRIETPQAQRRPVAGRDFPC